LSELYDYIIGTQTGSIATVMLTLRDEDNKPMYWAEDADIWIRENGHELFKTTNMSGFISFLLYSAFIGFFILSGFCAANICCPSY
jgi:patatin-like phospholipase/acyl hydrolase